MTDAATDAAPPPQGRPPTLLGLPSYLAGHVSRIGRSTLVGELASRGLRLPHFAIFAGLHDFGSLPHNELADRLGLNRSHLVGYLDELEDKDAIERSRDSSDRRRQLISLTLPGEELASELIEYARSGEATDLSVLNTSELATLTKLLRRVVEADDGRER
ncbi:MarR family winged helix-turn-helix transcriptional regulator [Humibacter sp. RRB41]|uniref:MarR family winged helix-turn-helix transcriptional regulator n=1 Tax=Humibacter sp. RRB41 TaxID=2919946 RepID=UPI001FAAE972|nr:MarR family winged helix-turn-helix transcriptional regulator [Humibacter sp. RRB41]